MDVLTRIQMLPLFAHVPNPLIRPFFRATNKPVHLSHPHIVHKPQKGTPLQHGVRVRRVKEAGDGGINGFIRSCAYFGCLTSRRWSWYNLNSILAH